MRILVKNVSFSYNPKAKQNDKRYALNNVSLTIESGEFFGIIGQTGSGKSTLIQHLNALLPLQEGQIFVGDFDLSEKDKTAKKKLKELRKRVEMVFQYPEYQLFAETVYEDVAFAVKNFFPGLSQSEITQKVGDAITAVGLNYNEIKDKSPFDLSGGQKRRVAIAGVLVADPEVLILDEPVAGLDPMGKRELMQLLHELNKGDRTVVIVSHDMDEVCENCSKIAIMRDGKVVCVGTPEEVFKSGEERLSLPVTARLKNGLTNAGIDIDLPLKTQDFLKAIIDYDNLKNH